MAGPAALMFGYLSYLGVSDRVLVLGDPPRQGWVGFFDWDLDWYDRDDVKEISRTTGRHVIIYRSGGGYHFVALDVTDWAGKMTWWKAWSDILALYESKADYILQRDNVIRVNAKNGYKPKFVEIISGAGVRARPWSSWHRKVMDLPYIHAGETPTLGRMKAYSSDPNGVFDIAASAMSA